MTAAPSPLHLPAAGIAASMRILRKAIPVWLKQHRLAKLRTWSDFHFGLRQRLRRELRGGRKHVPASRPLRILVPLIETAHYQHLHILMLVKALELRGAQVKLLICGQTLDGCEVKSIRNEGDPDRCWKCRFNERNVLPLFGLDVVRLSDFVSAQERAQFRREAEQVVASRPAQLIRHGVDLAQAISDSVTRYYYGAIAHDQRAVEAVRVRHTASALLSMEVAHRIDQIWQPDVVLTHMYCYGEWEPFFEHYRRHGNRFRSVSITPFDYHSLVFSGFELFQSTARFERYVASRSSPGLNERERGLLQQFIATRSSGKAKIFRDYGYFQASEDVAAISRQLGIEGRKRRIFLFSNVHWDVGMSACAGLFADTLSWVLGTIELIRNEPDCHLYIKPHPAEVFDSASSLKGVAQVVRERYPVLPPNVTIIEPQWKINTYKLFSLIDIGVIFNGTLGMEMMLAGIPVISTGRTTHRCLGFASEPQTLEAYRAALIGAVAHPTVDRERLELFGYFYFIRTLIPWRLTKQAYGDHFDGFMIDSLADVEPGRDPCLDHLCACILDPQHTIVEGWPEPGACSPAGPGILAGCASIP